MTFKELKNKIKEDQKTLALKIRNGKSGRKPSRRNSDNNSDYYDLEWNQTIYRYRHIVYCNMFNKTPYDAIEQPRDGNNPSSYRLEQIEKDWKAQLDEAICYS